MALPSTSAWKATVNKNEARARIEMQMFPETQKLFTAILDRYNGAPGTTELRATGIPGDEELRGLTRQHEKEHVRHIKEAFRNVVTPWDERICKYKSPKPPFIAKSVDTAEEEFYEAVQSPKEVGKIVQDYFQSSGEAFHGKPSGGKCWVDGVYETDDDPKTLVFRWRHPLNPKS
jgi:hypothetical protein